MSPTDTGVVKEKNQLCHNFQKVLDPRKRMGLKKMVLCRPGKARLSTIHVFADWLLDWSSAAKRARLLLITYLVAAFSTVWYCIFILSDVS